MGGGLEGGTSSGRRRAKNNRAPPAMLPAMMESLLAAEGVRRGGGEGRKYGRRESFEETAPPVRLKFIWPGQETLGPVFVCKGGGYLRKIEAGLTLPKKIEQI